ncbi:hypothetical protein ACA910_018000 [Epithemia clementina (nom. ined.)]
MLQEHIDKYSPHGVSQRQIESILDIVSNYPVVCQRKYQFKLSDGRTEEVYPLFVLLQLQPTLQLVEKVFEAHPGAMFDTTSYRPIDIACEMNASLEVVKFLHFQNPDAVCTPVKDGRYPLHVALSFYNSNIQHIQHNHDEKDYHLQQQQEQHQQHRKEQEQSKQQQQSEQQLSLSSASVIDFLLDTFPEAAGKQDSRGHYPLHHAAFSGAPVSTIKRLHALCAESVEATDNKNWTPLHCACRYGRYNEDNLAIIQYLVEHAPLSLSVQNQGGWTPVMTAVGYQSKDVILYLLDRIPHLSQNTIRSMLRLAAKHNTADSVEILAQRYPWMLTSQTQNSGGTPLHYAAKREDNPVDICRVLIEHNRQALTMTDHQGRLPLNCAYHIDANSATTRLLLQETAKGA